MKSEGNHFIGQVVPFEPGRGIEGNPMSEAVWFAFITPPRREPAAKAWLEKRGVEAWYPSEQRFRKQPRSRVKVVPYEARLVPRYLFARFHGQPQWDLLRASRYLSGVVGVEGQPMAISDTILSQMAAVPERLEILRRREIERRTILAGDRARIRDGAMEGWIVDVSRVHKGIAYFLVPLLGERETAIEATRLDKTQRLA